VAWGAIDGPVWSAIIYSGIGALVIANLFWFRGVRVLGPTHTAMFSNIQPAIALAVAWVALGEVPTIWQLVGAATIMGGLLISRT
jgi:drug/metabolite transporter (DMT)-like permease